MGHTVYVGQGYVFMDSVAFVAEITGDMLGLVVALVVAISAALWSRAAIKAERTKSQAEIPLSGSEVTTALE